ncbi:hypothetical protein [Spiroplasma endosymbiont of Apeira syringaria]
MWGEVRYLIQKDKDVLTWAEKVFGDKVEKIDFKKKVLQEMFSNLCNLQK